MNILQALSHLNYPVVTAEANEVDEAFINQAKDLFQKHGLSVPIHRANWLDLPKASPPYTSLFNFAFLTGNSLTCIGGGSREYTKKAQKSIISKFAELIEPGGYIFIDSRDYDFISALMHLPKEEVLKNFTFDTSVYYHGFPNAVQVFPAYISDSVVVLHYYAHEQQMWSKLDLYPVYENDMKEILSHHFDIEAIYYDFATERKNKSLFKQYLARKKV